MLKSACGRYRVTVDQKENGDMTSCHAFLTGLRINWPTFMKMIGQDRMAGFGRIPA
jgi:hypothetical protein